MNTYFTIFTVTCETFVERVFRDEVLKDTRRLRPWHLKPGFKTPSQESGEGRNYSLVFPRAVKRVPGRRGACGRKGY